MSSSSRLPLLMLLLVALVWTSRLFSPEGRAPAFSVHVPPPWQVALVKDGKDLGVYQNFDAFPSGVVNVLTKIPVSADNIPNLMWLNGCRVSWDSSRKVATWEWLPAFQRMALHIPLHPDRMKPEDWQALPGIGPALSAAIEADRQLNGDFERIVQVRRVKGIGPKRLENILPFF